MSHTIIPVTNGFEMRLPEVAPLETITESPEISFESWQTYMTEVWQTDQKWLLRSWQAAHRLALIGEPLPPEGRYLVGDLDINLARRGMRSIETGMCFLPSGVGRVCWNGVVYLNNRAARSKEDLILPWDDDIHPAFATISQSRREKSVTYLQETYQMLRSGI